MMMRQRHWLDRLLTPKAGGVHDLKATSQPEMPSDVGVPLALTGHELFVPPPALQGFKVGADIPDQDGLIFQIKME